MYRRFFRLVPLVLICVVWALGAQAATYMSENFESGMTGWLTWHCSGVTYNHIGSGMGLSMEGGNYAYQGPTGLHAVSTNSPYVTTILRKAMTASATGELTCSYAVRPFISYSQTNNGQYFFLGQSDPYVVEGGHGVGIVFGTSGKINVYYGPELGSYVMNQWVYITIHLNTTTQKFSVDVSGPGVPNGPYHAENCNFAFPMSAVNYFFVLDNSWATNEFALDSIQVSDSAPPGFAVSGTVLDGAGVGAYGASVSLVDANGLVHRTTVDDLGGYLFSDILAGYATLSVSPPCGLLVTGESVYVRNITGNTQVDFSVGPDPEKFRFVETFRAPGTIPDRWSAPEYSETYPQDRVTVEQTGAVLPSAPYAHGYSQQEADPVILLRDPSALGWSNYTFEFDGKMSSNDAWCYLMGHFYLQSADPADWNDTYGPKNGYSVVLKAYQNEVWVYRYVNGIVGTAWNTPMSIDAGVAYHVRVETKGDSIKVDVNGAPKLRIRDGYYTAGTIALSASTGGGSWTYVDAYYDNVVVCGTPIPSTAMVTGTARNNCGGVVAGVEVRALDHTGNYVTTTTDGSGTYSMEVKLGQTTVSVTAPSGYLVVGEGSSTSDLQGDWSVDFTLNPPSSFAGTVRDCHGGLGGVEITVVDGAGTSHVTESASNGAYGFTSLVPGSGQVTVAIPAGHLLKTPATPSYSLTLACSMQQDFEFACIAPIAGIVSNACGGAVDGVRVDLTDVHGAQSSTTTGADGHFQFADILFGQTTVAITVPEGFVGVDPVSRTFEHDGTVAANFVIAPLAQVSGTVVACGQPLANAVVYVVDGGQVQHETYTDEAGSYAFAGLIPGQGNLSYVLPLGYAPSNPASDVIAVDLACSQTQNFELSCTLASGPPRSMGYWKHEVQVYHLHRGAAQESEQDMTATFPSLIYQHFYANELNAIDIENVTYRMQGGMQPMDLATMYSTLWVSNPGTMRDRARQQYLATLLNLASGKLLVRTEVSVDGHTASQAVQYIADLIKEGTNIKAEKAKNLAEQMNLGQLIAAGEIPDSYENIPYRETVTIVPVNFHLGEAHPNPFNPRTTIDFSMPQASWIEIGIYDVHGRKVRTLTSAVWPSGFHSLAWDGRDDGGRAVSSGTYYSRMVTSGYTEKRTLTLLK